RAFAPEALALARLLTAHPAAALANAQRFPEVQAGRARPQGLSRQLLAAVYLALEATVIGLPPHEHLPAPPGQKLPRPASGIYPMTMPERVRYPPAEGGYAPWRRPS